MSAAAISPVSKKRLIKFGWGASGFLIITLVAFATFRSWDMFGGNSVGDPFAIRYLEHPVVSSLHMLFSIAFILFAPLQFNTKLRSKKPQLHRYLGRFLIFCALFSGIFGIAAIAVLPVFGGIASITASWIFGPVFLTCTLLAFTRARQKRFIEHREWIIRTFALGLGVGTQRLVLAYFQITQTAGFEEGFGPALWIGFTVNLIVAEIWINLSRKTKR